MVSVVFINHEKILETNGNQNRQRQSCRIGNPFAVSDVQVNSLVPLYGRSPLTDS
jgi:hypothetical protein